MMNHASSSVCVAIVQYTILILGTESKCNQEKSASVSSAQKQHYKQQKMQCT